MTLTVVLTSACSGCQPVGVVCTLRSGLKLAGELGNDPGVGLAALFVGRGLIVVVVLLLALGALDIAADTAGY